jgi:fibronectin-binding autotransporter adhesin
MTPIRSGFGRVFFNFCAGRNGWRVVLTALVGLIGAMSNVRSATDTWTGAGGNGTWTNSGNWSTLPSSTDTLEFSGSTNTLTTNNYNPNTQFNGIIFDSLAGTFTLGGATINLSGNIANNANAQTETISLGLDLQGTTGITTSVQGSKTIISGNISGTGPLTITDADTIGAGTTFGTTVLAGTDSFSGPTTLTGGSVVLDNGGGATSGAVNAHKLDPASSLTLGGSAGGVILTLDGTTTPSTSSTETVASTTITGGFSSITVANGIATSPTTLNLGAITANAGASLTIMETNTLTTLDGAVTTTTGTNGIVGGFAIYTTYAGSSSSSNPYNVTWAASSGTGTSTIGTYTGYTSTFAAGNNVQLTSASNNPGTFTINTLAFGAGGQTLTLTGTSNVISAGGILVPLEINGAVVSGTETITGGSFSTASNNDLNIFIQGSANTLAISSGITGNIGLNISPESGNSTGTVTLSGINTFTGNISVTGAILNIASSTALPSSTTGDTITLTSDEYSNSNHPGTLVDSQTSGNTTINSSYYVIQGNGNVSLTGSGTETLTLTGSHTYTGVTSIAGNGFISTNTLANGGTASGIGASSNAATNLVLGSSGGGSGGSLTYTGSGASTDRLFTLNSTVGNGGHTDYIYSSGSGALNFTNTGTINVLGTSGATSFGLNGTYTGANTFAPVIPNGTTGNTVSLNVFGSGSWILTGVNTYTGATTVGSTANSTTGSLLLGTGGFLSSGTPVTVAANSTFGTAGTNTVAKNVFSSTSTATLTLTLGSTNATRSNLQLNLYSGASSDTINAGSLALSGSGSILLTLDNPNSITPSGTYTLLTWTGGTALTTGEVTLAAGDPSGTLGYNSNSLTFTPTAAPEPSTWMLLLAGAGVLVVYQLRRLGATS